jgi:hypothetical protein
MLTFTNQPSVYQVYPAAESETVDWKKPKFLFVREIDVVLFANKYTETAGSLSLFEDALLSDDLLQNDSMMKGGGVSL